MVLKRREGSELKSPCKRLSRSGGQAEAAAVSAVDAQKGGGRCSRLATRLSPSLATRLIHRIIPLKLDAFVIHPRAKATLQC